MISVILLIVVLSLVSIPYFASTEYDNHYHWIWWILLNFVCIMTIFTGFPIKNNEGQYKGYVTAVEMNGAVFRGYNAYLKTDLQSSNEDIACIDRDNKQLIEDLKKIQNNKENITVEYEGVWQYPIGECPKSNFKIIKIIK